MKNAAKINKHRNVKYISEQVSKRSAQLHMAANNKSQQIGLKCR